MSQNEPPADRITRIACSACGAEMNPHAEKPVAPLTRAEAARTDWGIGALVEEVHQCPRCGQVESRRPSEGLERA